MGYGTTADLQQRLAREGVTASLTSEELQGLLDDAQDLIDGYCGRDFLDHPGETVTLEGKSMQSLLLPVAPLRRVTAIAIDGAALSDAELASLTVLPYGVIRGAFFPKGAVVEVTCDWGYEEPPVPVLQASYKLASRIYRFRATRDKLAQGLRSQSVEGVSFSADPLDMDRDVQMLLAPLRRRAVR